MEKREGGLFLTKEVWPASSLARDEDVHQPVKGSELLVEDRDGSKYGL